MAWFKKEKTEDANGSPGDKDERGNSDLKRLAASAYESGDLPTAVAILRMLAMLNDADADNQLGYMYQYGEGVDQSDVEAFEHYLRAAEAGSSRGQFNVAIFYDDGVGVPADRAKAAFWYLKAAQQDNGAAQINYGHMLRYGIGVAQDEQEAAKWFERALDKGHSQAAHNLAELHRDGKGVPQDFEAARALFVRAAGEGHLGSALALVSIYADGQGVPSDPIEAYRWILFAERFTNPYPDGTRKLTEMKQFFDERLPSIAQEEAFRRLEEELAPTLTDEQLLSAGFKPEEIARLKSKKVHFI